MSDRAGLFNKAGRVDGNDRYKTIPLGTLEYGIYKKAVDELKENLIFLLLYSSGEPFMNKHLPDMAAYATERHVTTIVSTNGHFFTGENCKKILEARSDLIFISVSGFDQETYAKYHQGGDVEKVKQGIRYLNRLRKEMKVSTIIAVRYLIFSYNEHLYKNDRKNYLSLGADFVLPRPGQFFDIEQADAFGPKGCIPYRASREKKNASGATDKPCPFLWNVSVIHWDGSVLPCCELSYNPEILDLNSIAKESFLNIWRGAQYANFRKAHLDGRRLRLEACKGCHVASSFFQA
jgi:radical SAM protein with 4Fe4S-binding SPASM domain